MSHFSFQDLDPLTAKKIRLALSSKTASVPAVTAGLGALGGGVLAYRNAKNRSMVVNELLTQKKKELTGKPVDKKDKARLQVAEQLSKNPRRAAVYGAIIGGGTGLGLGFPIRTALRNFGLATPIKTLAKHRRASK